MLRDLTIKNYRCFKDFSIDGLARVNLIVGKNNSGKTSFLEAVYLLRSEERRTALLRLLSMRGEYVEIAGEPASAEVRYPIAHLFRGHAARWHPEPKPSDIITIESFGGVFGGEQRTLTIRLETNESAWALSPSATLPDNGPSAYETALHNLSLASQGLVPYRLQLDYGAAAAPVFYPVDEGLAIRAARALLRADALGVAQFLPTGASDIARIADLWDAIVLAPAQEADVIAALQILEPAIVDLRLTSSRTGGGILLGLKGEDRRIPLSSLGEGVRRVLALALAAVGAEGNVLLVDEIDTGLYHGTLTDVWRFIIETAQRLNVQVFATTHNWESIEAFQEALQSSTDPSQGRLFRLQVRDGDIIPVDYDSDMLDVAVRHAIEVR